MVTPIEYGSVREAWMNTLSAPGTKYSFLSRDDSYQVSSATFGRTTRLGDPVALGPGSGWRQLTWEGGSLQDLWRDRAMYQDGNADVTSRAGGVRLWSGFDVIGKRRDLYVSSFAMAAGSGDGTSFQQPRLYFAERTHIYSSTNNPSGGFKAYSYDPTNNVYKQLNATYPAALTNSLGNVLQGYSGFTAICAATDDASSNEYVYFGTNLGLYIYYVTGDAWFADANCTQGRIARDSMVSYKDALYYCADKKLWKRTPVAGSYGINGTHTAVAEHAASVRTQGLAIWQNRLWYGVQYSGNKVAIGTSDGVTAAQAFQMPDDFQIGGLIPHYGALYVYGAAPQKFQTLTHAPSAVGQVWKYTGSSLTKIWESDDGTGRAWDDRSSAGVYCASTMGPLLLWGWSGQAGTTNERACIMAYDAEKDAVVRGPEIPQHPAGRNDGMLVTAMVPWNGTFAVAVRDLCGTYPGLSASADTSVLVWRKQWAGIHDQPNIVPSSGSVSFLNTFGGYSTEYADTTRTQYIVSSEYFGESDEVAAMNKVWLSGKARVKVPANTQLNVYAITEAGKWYPPGYANVSLTELDNRGRPYPQASGTLVATVTYNGSDDWRSVSWDMVDGSGAYLTSQRLRYALVLSSSETDNIASTRTPEVDSVEFTWSLIEPKRRQWRVRFVLSDGQLRLDGTANSLTTAAAMAQKLDDFWSMRTPFQFYPPDTGGGPSGSPVSVIAAQDGYSVQQYRVESNDTQVGQEVSMILVEHVTP